MFRLQFIQNKTPSGSPLNVICRIYIKKCEGWFEGREMTKFKSFIDACKIMLRLKNPYKTK